MARALSANGISFEKACMLLEGLCCFRALLELSLGRGFCCSEFFEMS